MKNCTKFIIFSYTLSALFVFSGASAVWAQAPETSEIAFTSKRDDNAEIYIMGRIGLIQRP